MSADKVTIILTRRQAVQLHDKVVTQTDLPTAVVARLREALRRA